MMEPLGGVHRVCLALLLIACSSKPTPKEAEPEPPRPATALSQSVDAAVAVVPAAQEPATARTLIEPWNIEIVLPKEAVWELRGKPERLEIAVGADKGAHIQRRSTPGPKTSAEAMAYWAKQQLGRDTIVLYDEQRSDGASFAARSYEVRMGMRRGDTNIHYYSRVSRIFGTVPDGSGGHLFCMVYLEFDAGDGSRLGATGKAWLELCRSIRIR